MPKSNRKPNTQKVVKIIAKFLGKAEKQKAKRVLISNVGARIKDSVLIRSSGDFITKGES